MRFWMGDGTTMVQHDAVLGEMTPERVFLWYRPVGTGPVSLGLLGMEVRERSRYTGSWC